MPTLSRTQKWDQISHSSTDGPIQFSDR